ncbi:MAG TPA: hypothetical protein VHZ95_21745, partial [Polyangiales bacterium]|nr:hypothetical protein [Polyangiales bacterium]
AHARVFNGGGLIVPRETVTYQREKLYVELWNEPSSVVAERYGVSNEALCKTCKKLDVPKPPRGYWARRAVGKIDPMPPLPKAKGVPVMTVVRPGRRPNRERTKDALVQGRAAMGPPILVPERVAHPHELVASAIALLSKGKVRNGVVPLPDERCLDIVVSPPLLLRASRIMNTLILALEERGMPVELTEYIPEGEPHRDARSNLTRVLVNGEWLRFSIVERLRQHQPPMTANPPRGLSASERELWTYWNRPRMTLVPSGALVLQFKEADIGVRLSWMDAQVGLEHRLNDFIKQLFVVADAKRQAREADATWRKSFDADTEAKRAARERAAEEARKLAALREAVGRWREAREIREFVREAMLGQITVPDHARELLAWADVYAADSLARAAPPHEAPTRSN